jgi:hypothetical protein
MPEETANGRSATVPKMVERLSSQFSLKHPVPIQAALQQNTFMAKKRNRKSRKSRRPETLVRWDVFTVSQKSPGTTSRFEERGEGNCG